MYHFAVVALLGLTVMKLTDLVEELVPAIDRARTLFSLALAVVVAVVLDYSLFKGFGIGLRQPEMGVWATGLIIGSVAAAWRHVLGWLGVAERAEPGQRRLGRTPMAA